VLIDDRRVVLLTLLAQLGISLVLAAALGLWHGKTAAVSALVGGMTAVVPNGFLAARLIKPRAANSADALLRSAWLGEIGKLLLTALLFGAVFAGMRPISAPAVFVGFIGAQFMVFAALLLGGRAGSSTATAGTAATARAANKELTGKSSRNG
jgi:ATP synthase protein I